MENSDSAIIFGNKEGQILLTILTNPHCTPCIRLHTRIRSIVTDSRSNFRIQYLYTSFGKDYDESSLYMISLYLHHPIEETLRIYDEWYRWGKVKRHQFFKAYPSPIEEKVLKEYEKHNAWTDKHQLMATPTILVNGYELPASHQIEDILYLTKIPS
ncbi:MAG: DsbA family protein [Tannerellaceae bacterium]|nr:DsbA family protein [Tannerellaceae bacterium]